MAKNTDALEARRAQDVVAYVPFPLPVPPALQPPPPPPDFPQSQGSILGLERTTKQSVQTARHTNSLPSMPRRESGNNTHVGRGGAANVFKPSAADLETAKKDNAKWESAVGDDRSEDGREGLVPGATAGKGGVKSDGEKSKGLADRGKEWLMGKMGK